MSTGRAASTNRSMDSRSDIDNDLLLSDIANYDCNELKMFLDAVYNYRSPRDKIGQDKRFLKLLEQTENEEKNLRVVSSDQRPKSKPSTSTGPIIVTAKPIVKNTKPNNNSKSLEDVSSVGEKSNQTRSKYTSGNFRRMYCNGYGPENDEESVHLNDDSFHDIGVFRQSDENSDYSDDSDESEHLSSMVKGVMPLCMDKVLSSKAEHARATKKKLAEIRESIKLGQESEQQPETKTTTCHDDVTKKSKHGTRRSRRETEIKIDYYSTNNIDALVYHINSGATSTIEEALAVTTTNQQNKPRNKSSKMKKYRSFEDLRNTKKSHGGSKKNSAGATPSLPSSNQQKSKLEKSSSLENLNNNTKKKNSSKNKCNVSSGAFLRGVDVSTTTTTPTTAFYSLPVPELPIKWISDCESGIVDSLGDFHEVKKRRKKTRAEVMNPIEKISKKAAVTTKPTVVLTKNAPVNKSSVQLTKTVTTTPTNCDTKPVQFTKPSNDEKKSSYAEIMKSGRLTTDNNFDSNNNSIAKTSPSVNGFDSLEAEANSISRKLVIVDDGAKSSTDVDTDTNNYIFRWVNKYQDNNEFAHFHEQFVNYLHNAWCDTVNKSPPHVYYNESPEANL